MDLKFQSLFSLFQWKTEIYLHTYLYRQDQVSKFFFTSESIHPTHKKRWSNDLIPIASNSFLPSSPHLKVWYLWQTYSFVVDKVKKCSNNLGMAILQQFFWMTLQRGVFINCHSFLFCKAFLQNPGPQYLFVAYSELQWNVKGTKFIIINISANTRTGRLKKLDVSQL